MPANNRLSLAFAALVGITLTWLATSQGPGLLPDSVVYLRGVRSLLGDTGAPGPGAHFPPGYATLWAAGTWLVGNEWLAARLLNVFSLVLVATAFSLILQRALPQQSNRLLLPALLLLLCSSSFASLFWMALSESSFLACYLWATYSALILCERPGDRKHWLLLLICLSAMLLLRYAAAPLIAALLLAPLLTHPSWRALGRLSMAGVLIALPLLAWLLWGVSEGGSTPRQLGFHTLDSAHLMHMALTLSSWLGRMPHQLALGCVVALLIASVGIRDSRKQTLVRLCLLLVAAYTSFLVLTLLFFDALTPLDPRILSPLLPLLILMFCALPLHGTAVAARLLLMVSLVAANLFYLVPAVADSAQNGVGFNARPARTAAIFSSTASLPPEIPIYTNAPEYYYLHYNRETRQLPAYYHPNTRVFNPSLNAEWEAIHEAMRQEDAIIVWASFSAYRAYFPTVTDMLSFGTLQVQEEFEDGVVLRLLETGTKSPGTDVPQT